MSNTRRSQAFETRLPGREEQEDEVASDLVLSQGVVAARGWTGQGQPVDQNAPEAESTECA